MLEHGYPRLRSLSRYRFVVRLASIASAAMTNMACQLVLGEIPPSPERDGGDAPTDARNDEAPAERTDGGEPADARLVETGEGAANADPITPDSASLLDASPPTSIDAGATCGSPLTWYIDEDKDGYGRTDGAVYDCSMPGGGPYVLVAGDCNDSDDRVHPGQIQYFGTSYRKTGGEISFDYDCSGIEQPDPLQHKAQDCGLLSLTLCGGTGYARGARQGPGIDAFCGSTIQATCVAELAGLLKCVTLAEDVEDPFRCR